MATKTAIQKRLDYLRSEIEAERISYSEISELQGLAEHIDPSDTVLLQWAGVPEFPELRVIEVEGFPKSPRSHAELDQDKGNK